MFSPHPSGFPLPFYRAREEMELGKFSSYLETKTLIDTTFPIIICNAVCHLKISTVYSRFFGIATS